MSGTRNHFVDDVTISLSRVSCNGALDSLHDSNYIFTTYSLLRCCWSVSFCIVAARSQCTRKDDGEPGCELRPRLLGRSTRLADGQDAIANNTSSCRLIMNVHPDVLGHSPHVDNQRLHYIAQLVRYIYIQ